MSASTLFLLLFIQLMTLSTAQFGFHPMVGYPMMGYPMMGYPMMGGGGGLGSLAGGVIGAVDGALTGLVDGAFLGSMGII
ncbi:hypothetical protein V3C99_014859 [Haemonchus contortus]